MGSTGCQTIVRPLSTEAEDGHNGGCSEISTLNVPDVAIKWITYNCFSDTELATLSNVSRFWRKAVTDAIMSLSALLDEQTTTSVRTTTDGQDGGTSPSTTIVLLSNIQEVKTRILPPLSSLILPSILMEKTRQEKCHQVSCSNQEDTSATEKQSTLHVAEEDGEHVQSYHQETFCLAWFHPMGIQFANAPSKSLSTKCHESLVPCLNKETILSRFSAKDCCASEWRSYENAEDVLQPFFYSKKFIQVRLGDWSTCLVVFFSSLTPSISIKVLFSIIYNLV